MTATVQVFPSQIQISLATFLSGSEVVTKLSTHQWKLSQRESPDQTGLSSHNLSQHPSCKQIWNSLNPARSLPGWRRAPNRALRSLWRWTVPSKQPYPSNLKGTRLELGSASGRAVPCGCSVGGSANRFRVQRLLTTVPNSNVRCVHRNCASQGGDLPKIGMKGIIYPVLRVNVTRLA